MIRLPRRLVALRLGLCLLVLVTCRSAAWCQAAARVLTVTGQLTVRRAGAGRPAAIGAHAPLNVRDVVHTGPASKATLLFSNGADVRLNANADLQITPPTPLGHGKLSLWHVIRGEVAAHLRPNGGVSTHAVKLGAYGTEIDLVVADDDTTTLTVIEGEVEYFNDFGTVVVRTSQQSVARPGSAPTMPVTIDNPGLVIQWTLDLDRIALPREKFFISSDPRLVATALAQRRARVTAAPGEAAAHRDYGDALYDSRQYNHALQEYREADRLAPGQAATLSRLGYALLETEQVDEAEQSFHAAQVAAAPGSADQLQALVGLATLQLSRGRASDAEVTARQAVALGQPSAEAYLQLGLAQMRQGGKLDDAVASFKAALGAPPLEYAYQARSWLGLAYLSQDDRAAALREAQAAVRLAPGSALAAGNLALVYFFNDRPREAERAARAAVAANPNSVAAQTVLAQSLLARGDTDAATAVAARAAALDPQMPAARYLLGVAEASRRDYHHAERELQAALKLAPDFLPAASALARIYNSEGRQNEAVTLLTNLLPHHPRPDDVLAALGAVYYEQAKYREAQAQYRAALKLRPNSALYYAELARVQLYSNDLANAIASGQRAVELAPGSARYHATLGLAYDFSGLTQQAEREYREALTLDPQNALARAQLGFRTSNPTTNVNAVTQAFLYDPAISEQLLRGGINTELTPSLGSHADRQLSLANRAVSDEGLLHSFTLYNHETDNAPVAAGNNHEDQTTFAQYTTFGLGSRTELFSGLARFRSGQALPGLPFPGTPFDVDDRTTFEGDVAELALRHRIAAGQHLWAGLTYQPSSNDTVDPDRQTNPPVQLGPGVFVGRSQLAVRNLVSELRYDVTLNRDADRLNVFTLGLARVRQHSHQTFTAFANNIPPAHLAVETTHQNATVAYAQLAQRFGPKLSLVAQLRQHSSASAAVDVLDGQLLKPAPGITDSSGQPSLVATYNLNHGTILRLFAHRTRADDATIGFAPTDTLLAVEPATRTSGVPAKSSLLELDAERYLPSHGFVKLFAFQNRSQGVRWGSTAPDFGFQLAAPVTAGQVRLSGLGARYEQQLARHVYGQAAYVYAHSSNSTPGAAFDRQQAPYQPLHQANFTVHYVSPSGLRLLAGTDYIGSYFQDSGAGAGTARPRFPAHFYLNLGIVEEPNVHTSFFVILRNVLNRPSALFNGFPNGQRQLQVGVTKRF